jgi:hypothetical protein
MKPTYKLLSGGLLALFTTLAAACNPFDALDPRATSASGLSGSDEMCAVNRNLGECPPPPPSDFIP